MLLLFAGLCMAALFSILLYVLVHGLEQGQWELRYPLALAAALPAALLLYMAARRSSKPARLSPLSLSALLAGLAVLCLLWELWCIHALPLEPIGDYRFFSALPLTWPRATRCGTVGIWLFFPISSAMPIS